MTQFYHKYKAQYKKAKEMLEILEKQRQEINSNLEIDPICATLHKELRTVNMDIKITLNEIEQAEFDLNKSDSQKNISII
jgi:hypothetical protein